jgi:hypothetical protein
MAREHALEVLQLSIRRRLGAGDLQLLLLLLLQENPRHGYELIKELEQRTSGYYSPSPGVIYPRAIRSSIASRTPALLF